MVKLAVDPSAAQPLYLSLDVLDGREHQRGCQPLGESGEVEHGQWCVRWDRGGLVGDVGKRAVLAVGLEAQQQRLQPIGVGAGERAGGGTVRERIDEKLLPRALPGLAGERVRGFDAGANQRLLIGVEGANAAFGVVGVPDEQCVKREQ